MPTVPILSQPQVQPPRLPNVQIPESVPDNGGAALGQGLDTLATVLNADRIRADQTAVMSADTQRESWANTRLYDPQTGAFNKEGANALGVTNEVLSDYDKQTQQIAAGLTGERQQRMFTQSSAQQRVALQGQLARFEFEQRSKYEDQTAKARIDSAVQTGALNYTDPTMLGQARQAIVSTLQAQKDSKGWGAEELQAATTKALSELHGDVIERMIADDKLTDARTYLGTSKAELT
jgi:hypothetical protein